MDVFDSAKGWAGEWALSVASLIVDHAAVIKFHPEVYRKFQEFYERKDTFRCVHALVCINQLIIALQSWHLQRVSAYGVAGVRLHFLSSL